MAQQPTVVWFGRSTMRVARKSSCPDALLEFRQRFTHRHQDRLCNEHFDVPWVSHCEIKAKSRGGVTLENRRTA
jgi:hypothetical protein